MKAVHVLGVVLFASAACGGASRQADAGGGDVRADQGADAPDAVIDAVTLDAETSADLPNDIPPFDAITPGQCTLASVKGVTCAPNDLVIVAYADVTLDISGPCTAGKTAHLTAKADAKGQYEFDSVPVGDATLSFQSGSYKSSSDLTILPGDAIDLTLAAGRCFTVGAANLAVILGSADHIEQLLDDLKLTYKSFADTKPAPTTSPAYALLKDPVALGKYDVLFINCSSSVQKIIEADASVAKNLKAFVESGKSLYASDWAWAYIEKAWPGAIQFAGKPASFTMGNTGKPDSTAGPRQGPGGSNGKPYTLTGQVVDQDLVNALGKGSVTIYFNQATWVVMDGPGTGTTHIEGDIAGGFGTKPLIVSFQPAGTQGHVIFTSFHNIAQQDAGGDVTDIKAILSYFVFKL